MQKLTIRIETTQATKMMLPWVALTRPGRQHVESQFFGLLGYPEHLLQSFDAAKLERSREALETALRLLSAFEYIPRDEQELESFFEKKLLAFETRLRTSYEDAPALHMGLGVVHGTRIVFATSGDVSALQLTESSINNLMDARGEGPLHFSSLHVGTLYPHAYLLFLPKTIGTLLKSDELKNLATARSSERKLEYLEHICEKRNTIAGSFRGILLEARPKLIRPEGTTAVSIAHLLNTESATEELLSPPLLRPLLKSLQSSGNKTYTYFTTLFTRLREAARSENLPPPARGAVFPKRAVHQDEPIQPRPSPVPEETAPIPTFSSILKKTSARTGSVAQSILTPLKTALSPDTVKQWANPGTLFSKIGNPILNWFNRLPLKSKTLFLCIITFLFVFVQAVLLTNRRTQLQVAHAALTEDIQSIQILIDAGSAALIYHDETSARQSAEDARARLELLQHRNDDTARNAKNEIITLDTSLSALRQRLRHAVVIDSPNSVSSPLKESLGLGAPASTPVLFGTRLYTLDQTANQIMRQDKKGAELGAPTPWIQDGTDVSGAISLALDGFVYVGYPDGRVSQFLKGRRRDFPLATIDPPLTSLKKIWTNENSDYLYVLDQTEKRLAVFSKRDAALKAQYLSSKFTDLKDFSIDEIKKTGYLLDGENVVSIPLNHFAK